MNKKLEHLRETVSKLLLDNHASNTLFIGREYIWELYQCEINLGRVKQIDAFTKSYVDFIVGQKYMGLLIKEHNKSDGIRVEVTKEGDDILWLEKD